MQIMSNSKVAEHLNQVPAIYRDVYEKAVAGKSKSAAVKAFCLECVCWQKNEITNCTSVTCPLYTVRPFNKKSD